MSLALDKILFVRFNNDFVGKILEMNLFFILFYSNPIKYIQIQWFLYKVFYSLTLRCTLFTKKSYVW